MIINNDHNLIILSVRFLPRNTTFLRACDQHCVTANMAYVTYFFWDQ